MNILYSEEFRKRFHALPKVAQRTYNKQEGYFRGNWKDSRLHTKKLEGRTVVFSFRVARDYRVLFVFVDNDTALFSAIGHRKEIYRKR